MMRIKTESFLADVRDRVDELCLSVPEIEASSGIHNSVLYRILEGSRKTVDRATLRRLGEALDMDFRVKGDWATLTARRSIEDVHQKQGGDSLRDRLETMFKNLSYEQLVAADMMTKMIAMMEGQELVDLVEMMKRMQADGNKDLFVKKIRAFSDLLMPYQSVVENEPHEKT